MKKYHNIAGCVQDALEAYFHDLSGETPSGIYHMVLKTIERPVFEVTLRHAKGNQRLAAEMLGINRNTLRKKIDEHQLLEQPPMYSVRVSESPVGQAILSET